METLQGKTMKLQEINKWWQRSMAKERARNTNTPKPFKGQPYSVPTNLSNIAPSRKQLPNPHAR